MYASMVRYGFLSYVTLRGGGKQALGSDVGRRYWPRPYWPQTMTISVTHSVGLRMRPSKFTWSPRVQRLFITVHRHFSPMTVWTQGPRHFGTNAEVPIRQFGTRAEMCCGHFGTKEDISAPGDSEHDGASLQRHWSYGMAGVTLIIDTAARWLSKSSSVFQVLHYEYVVIGYFGIWLFDKKGKWSKCVQSLSYSPDWNFTPVNQ